MTTYSRLVELISVNVADDFDSLDEAMNVLSDAVETHGADAMGTSSLLEVVDGAATLVAMDDGMLELVARWNADGQKGGLRPPEGRDALPYDPGLRITTSL